MLPSDPTYEAVREVAAALSLSMLQYVARAVGSDEAERIRLAVGEARSLEQLGERGAWSTVAGTTALGVAAALATRDGAIGRRGGETLFASRVEAGLTDILRAEGSVRASLERAVAFSARMSVARAMVVVARHDDHLLVDARDLRGAKPDALHCDFAVGYWSQIPSLFGAQGITDTPSDTDVADIAERLLESLRAPFSVDGHQLFISCSIGVAVTSSLGAHDETLVQRADAAMHDAKARGGDTFSFSVHTADPAGARPDLLELETPCTWRSPTGSWRSSTNPRSTSARCRS